MTRRVETWILGAVIFGVAVLAALLQRNGHTQGDDFALFLRQARSLFDGDTVAVIADNRFSVINSGQQFSPPGYPWGWPLVLAPFVRFWGLDYERLKLLEIAALCIWLVLLHGIVRRRIGWLPAIVVVAVVGTAPAYLEHTDELLSELPYLAVVGVVIWWYDRIRTHGDLLGATTRQLVVLGLLGAAAFNVRREGIVLIGVIAAAQLLDLAHHIARHVARTRADPTTVPLAARLRGLVPALLTPHLAFVGGIIAWQLLLPTTLLPDNDNSFGNVDDRLRELPANLADQLALGLRPQVGIAVLALAGVGAVIGLRRRAPADLPIIVLVVLSSLTIGTHFREVGRYWLQVTPWILYFVAAALTGLVPPLFRHRHRLGLATALAPLVILIGAHGVVLAGDVRDARSFDADGHVQWGPTHPVVVPVYDAVRTHTPPDATIAFYRARTMTLLTDRRAIQTMRIEGVLANADYFAQWRGSGYAQSDMEPDEARALGMVEVWSDPTWILWRLPGPDGTSE